MTKRIAIQIFGHLRSFEQTVDSLHEYLVLPNKKRGYEVDIFMHTWDETDLSTIAWHNQQGEKLGRKVTKEIVDFIEEKYSPRKYLVEAQIDVPEQMLTAKLGRFACSYKGFVNTTYTQFMSNKLREDYEKENKIKYDWVIVTRPDILFHQPLDIEKILHVYKDYGWQIPKNGLFFGHNLFARGDVEDKHMYGGTDLIFFGNPKTINKSSSFYKLIAENKITPQEIDKNFYCFEAFWYAYWLRKRIEPIRIKYFQFSSYNIIRKPQDYNEAIKNSKEELKKANGIKLNAHDKTDHNIKFNAN